MNEISRREFLRRAILTACGASLLPFFGTEPAEASPLHEEDMEGSYIHKRFFSFSEYVERPATERIVIHHTEIEDMTKGGTAALIHALHKKNNWAGIGYHYFIRPDGMIEQGMDRESFHRDLDELYRRGQSILYLGDKENANYDSALVSTKRSLLLNYVNERLYEEYFLFFLNI